jgi:hypothetical protein
MRRVFGVEGLSRCWVIFGDLSIEYYVQGSMELLSEGGVNSHWQTNFPRLALIMLSYMLRNSIHLYAWCLQRAPYYGVVIQHTCVKLTSDSHVSEQSETGRYNVVEPTIKLR